MFIANWRGAAITRCTSALRKRARGRTDAWVDRATLAGRGKRGARAQVTTAHAGHLDGGAWPPSLDGVRGKADVVFVDAPCSGIGALRRNPEARWRMRESDLAVFAKRQGDILDSAFSLCAPGGRIVYATCTLLRVENQDVVDSVLARRPELAGVPLAEVLGDRATGFGDGDSFTVAPHTHGTDGFFARVLRRQ